MNHTSNKNIIKIIKEVVHKQNSKKYHAEMCKNLLVGIGS